MYQGCSRNTDQSSFRQPFFGLSDLVCFGLIFQVVPDVSYANRQFGVMGPLYVFSGIVLVAVPLILSLLLWRLVKRWRSGTVMWQRAVIRCIGVILGTLFLAQASFVYLTAKDCSEVWWWIFNLVSLSCQGVCVKHLVLLGTFNPIDS